MKKPTSTFALGAVAALFGAASALAVLPASADGQILASDREALDLLRELRIEPPSDCNEVRSEYGYQRKNVLLPIAREMGGAYGPYTQRLFPELEIPGQDTVEVEHIVALDEADASGMCGRSTGEKRVFGSDPLNLTFAARYVNGSQEKHAKDIAEWAPPCNRGWFADRVVRVKHRYDLTVDTAEVKVLRSILNGPYSTDMEPPPSAGYASCFVDWMRERDMTPEGAEIRPPRE